MQTSARKQDAEDDYYFIELTDEEDVPNAGGAPDGSASPTCWLMRYDNKRTRSFCAADSPEEAAEKTADGADEGAVSSSFTNSRNE